VAPDPSAGGCHGREATEVALLQHGTLLLVGNAGSAIRPGQPAGDRCGTGSTRSGALS
jgi:hypothetical protein